MTEKAKQKKEKKFAALGSKEANAKKQELVKELLTAKLSLDHETLRARGGMAGVRRDLRLLNQRIAVTQTK